MSGVRPRWDIRISDSGFDRAFSDKRSGGCVVATGRMREGIGFDKDAMQPFLCSQASLASQIVGLKTKHELGSNTMADLVENVEKASDAVDAAYDRFQEKRDKFRSEIKNEIASVASAASKFVSEFDKIRGAVEKMQALMSSAEMAAAIANAERLAVALKALSEIDSHKLTFAVIDKAGA